MVFVRILIDYWLELSLLAAARGACGRGRAQRLGLAGQLASKPRSSA